MAHVRNDEGDLFEIDEATGEHHLASNGSSTPSGGVPSIPLGDIVSKISERVTKEVSAQVAAQILGNGNGGGGNGGPPVKTFLGSSAKNWFGSLVKSAAAIGLAVIAWVIFVNDSIKDRPTYEEADAIADEVAKEASDMLGEHEDHGSHPKVDELLEVQQAQLKIMSDMQIRQTIILENHEESIDDNKDDIKAHVRRHGRGQNGN